MQVRKRKSEMKSLAPQPLILKLAFLYIVFLGWTNLIRLPYFYTRIQIPEIIFLVLLVSIILSGQLPKLLRRKPDRIDYPIFLYLIANFLSALFSAHFTSWMEVLGSVYLFAVYWVFRHLCRFYITDSTFLKWLRYAALLAVLPALAGGLIALSGTNNYTVWWYPNYPYLGDLYRLRGFMQSPNLLFDFLFLSLLFQINFGNRNTKNPSFWLAITGMAGTLSKSVLLVPGMLGIAYSKRKIPFLTLLGGIFLLGYFLSAYFLVKECNPTVNKFSNHARTAVFQKGQYCVYPTTYFVLHKSQIRSGHHYLPFGAGPGCFLQEVSQLKKGGNYPEYLQDLEAHSTLFGTYFEIGLPGLIALVWLCWVLFHHKKRLMEKWQAGFLSIILFMALQAIFNDINGFRHYWVILAFYASLTQR